MMRIFNTKTKSEIIIDEKLDWVQVMPMDYMIPAHIKIELKGFFFGNHASNCKDCNSFIKSFGKNSNDWLLEYNLKKYKIDTNSIGSNEYGGNQIKQTISDFEYGTVLVLSIMELNIEELNLLLIDAVSNENYENACVYRDLIVEAKS